MKLTEIVDLPSSNDQLDEINLKHATAAGALALGTLLSPNSTFQHQVPTPSIEQAAKPSVFELEVSKLADTILSKYRISPELATKVATLAKQNEKATFPTAKDILAIVGIESSFIPNSVSGLKKDPAIGLMQVRPKVWGLNPNALHGNMELQVKTGADILNKYYNLLGNKEDAVHAYNVGLGNFRRGKHNIDYVHDYKNELRMYKI